MEKDEVKGKGKEAVGAAKEKAVGRLRPVQER